ncbi:MAG: PCMD domain-containing protein [Bacteroidaceae bacterium]|nr:PCMD domain-containing protein [Bacteroidaceae bacterium]
MNKTTIASLVALPILLASCIAAEQPNTECDIETVSLRLETPTDFFYHDYDTLRTVISAETDIVFTIRSYANILSVPLSLRITDGASVFIKSDDGTEVPFLNGSDVDLSDEKVRHFRVVSEDGAWSRNYTISVVHDVPSEGNLFIDFESYRLDASGKYYIWDAPEVFTDGLWKNGNPGFKISRSSAKPMEYPSTPVAGGGPDGSACLKLETCDTGPFGRMANMRLASGSMFNGIFDVGNALKDALKATQFGSPFVHKPVQMRAWLRYEPGATFQDFDGKTVSGVTDEPDAYVVLYRNEDASGNKVQLDGNDVLSSPYIVALGRLPHHYNEDGSDRLSNNPIHGITNEWQEVTIPVEYKAEIDNDVLENKGYSLIIGFASSWGGAYFKGAIGSKLHVDNVRLFCE